MTNLKRMSWLAAITMALAAPALSGCEPPAQPQGDEPSSVSGAADDTRGGGAAKPEGDPGMGGTEDSRGGTSTQRPEGTTGGY